MKANNMTIIIIIMYIFSHTEVEVECNLLQHSHISKLYHLLKKMEKICGVTSSDKLFIKMACTKILLRSSIHFIHIWYSCN